MQVETSLGLDPGNAFGIALRTTLLTRLRWSRRQFLRRRPGLRYFDPLYMYSAIFGHRLDMLRKLLATGQGFRHLLSQLPARTNYARIWTDLIEGRGR